MTIEAIRPSAPATTPSDPAPVPPARPIDRIAVAVLLLGTAVFYLWNITVNGSANVFYAGAAWAGSHNWEALLFGSVDPSNFITVDKPPVSQWVMGLSGQIFGYSSASMLIPEALMGVASVALMYAAGTRVAGRGAGLIAGAALALTPVAAMMFRFNNPDAAMVLLMTAAAYCAIRATATASGRWLALAGVAVGFAFLAKMLEGLMVLPALGLVYLVAAPTEIGRRVVHLVIAAVAMIVSAGWYVLLTLWWPASSRPYLAGSTDNNFMNLVLGYNGLARIEGKQGGGGARNLASSPQAEAFLDRIRESGGAGGRRGGPAGMFADGPGITRLFSGEFGIEISWLIPAALVALVVALVLRGRAPRTDLMRAGVLVFGLWMIIDGLVLSYMKSNPHPYYSLAIAPPIAGVIGLGVTECWRQRDRITGVVGMAGVVGAAGIWGFVLMERQSTWLPAVRWTVLVATVAAVVAILAVGLTARSKAADNRAPSRRRRVLMGVAVIAVLGSLMAPAAYATEVVATPHTGGGPSVSPATEDRPSASGGFGSFFGGTSDKSPQLKSLLGATSSRWAAAVSRSSTAAQIELDTDQPVMAIGGFTNDPAPTLTQFEQYVRNGDVTYYLLSANGSRGGRPDAGAASGGGRSGGGSAARPTATGGLDPALAGQADELFARYNSSSVTGQIEQWVQAHYTPTTVGSYQVYDLRHPSH